jgi:stearoyl-CoA desaturase (delta-9 desaturase)
MTRAERTANLVGVVLPFLGLLAAVVLLWNRAIDLIDIGIMAATYLFFAFGVTIGYHRLLTHRSFQTRKGLEYMWAVLGSMGLQGSVMDWVADHRKHHAHTDQEGDPHSPHVGHGEGLRGLWHAHTGWLFETHGQADWKKYARDLYEDPGMRRIGRLFPWLALASLLVPTALGFVLHGFTLGGALRGLIWGGLVRAFFLRSATSSAAAASRSRTTRPTSPGWRCPRSARPGTTTTMRSRGRRCTACGARRSTSPVPSSA